MSVEIEYDLTGVGWARCTIQVGDIHAKVTASYLSGALDDLVGAVIDVLAGQPSSRASFWEEPGEYRWILRAQEPDRVRIQILDFPDLYGGKPDAEGKVILDAECDVRELGRALLRALESLERKYGTDGYAERWARNEFASDGASFPSGLMVKLRELTS